ncbi:MAG: hypothetical protein V3U49_01345 [Nitrososphaerales archaeon]
MPKSGYIALTLRESSRDKVERYARIHHMSVPSVIDAIASSLPINLTPDKIAKILQSPQMELGVVIDRQNIENLLLDFLAFVENVSTLVSQLNRGLYSVKKAWFDENGVSHVIGYDGENLKRKDFIGTLTVEVFQRQADLRSLELDLDIILEELRALLKDYGGHYQDREDLKVKRFKKGFRGMMFWHLECERMKGDIKEFGLDPKTKTRLNRYLDTYDTVLDVLLSIKESHEIIPDPIAWI